VKALKKNQVCFDTVIEAYGYVIFEGDNPNVYYNSTCQYPPKVLCIYAAGEIYCTSSEIKAGIELLAQYCEEYGPDIQLLPISDFQSNLTEMDIQNLPVVTLDEVQAENIPYSSPVLISSSFFDDMHKTVVTWDYEMWTHQTYGFVENFLKRSQLNVYIVYICYVWILGINSSHRHNQQYHQLVLFTLEKPRTIRP